MTEYEQRFFNFYYLLYKCQLTDKEILMIILHKLSNFTLRTISHDYNCSRERIRQIEANSLLKIKHSKFFKINLSSTL